MPPPQQITTAAQNPNANPSIVPNTSAPAQTGSQPNWLEKLLPTAGGILGGIGGEALDVFGGGVAGAAGGDAAGKFLENKLTGQGGGNGVTSSAIQGGIGQGVGGLIGKGISGVAGKIIAPAAEKIIPGLLVKQSGDLSDQDTANYLANNGFSTFKDAVGASKQLTGAPGQDEGAVVNKAIQNALDNNSDKTLDLTNEGQTWMTPLQKYPSVNGAPVKNISDTVTRSFNQMAKDSGLDMSTAVQKGGNVTEFPQSMKGITPGAAVLGAKTLRNAADAVGASARDATGAVINPAQAAAQDTYNNLASSIEHKTLGVDLDGSQTLPFEEADRTALKSSISGIQSQNPTLYKNLSDSFDNAKSWQDVRSTLQPFVKTSLADKAMQAIANKAPGQSASEIAQSIMGTTGALAGAGGPKGLLGAATGLVSKSKAADEAATKGLGAIAKGAKGKIVQKVLPLATRAAGVAAANLPSDASQPSGVQSNTGAMTPGATTMQPTAGAVSPYDQAIQTALYQMRVDPLDTGAASIVQSALPQLQKAGVAQAQLGGEQAALANTGGPQGIAGILSKLTGLIPGTPQAQLNTQNNTLAGTLGVNPALTPSVLQNPQTAGISTQTLQQIIAAMSGGAPASAIPMTAVPGGYQ